MREQQAYEPSIQKQAVVASGRIETTQKFLAAIELTTQKSVHIKA